MMKAILGLVIAASALLSFAPAAMADDGQCLNYMNCDRNGSCHFMQVCPDDNSIYAIQ